MGGGEGRGQTTRATKGVVVGGRGGYDNTMAEEASPVRFSDGSRNGGTGDNYSYHCGGQGEKIPMSGWMRIAKIVKINFITASAISFETFQKLLLIPIATLILPPSPKIRIDWSIRHHLLCRRPPP